MNSKVLIIDTDTVNRSPMLSWWERHKEEILYCDEMEDFDAYIRENVHRGIMVITENDALTQRMRDYSNELDEAAGEHGGLCVGDAEVFNEPRQCIFEGEGLFRSDMPSESAAAENEFLRKYPYKEEDVAGRREAVAEEAASDESSTSEEERGARRPGLITFKEWLAAQPPDESDSDREWLNDNGDDSDEEAGALGRPGPQVKKQFEEWLVTQPPDQVVGWAALAEAGSSVRREMLAAAKEAVAENAAVERPWLVISDAERAVAKDFLSQPFIERFGDSDEEEEAEDEEEKETQFKKQFEEWLPTQPPDQVEDWAALAAAGPVARREMLGWAKDAMSGVVTPSDADRATAQSFLSQPFIAWFNNDSDDDDHDDEKAAEEGERGGISDADRAVVKDFLSQPFDEWFGGSDDNDSDDDDHDDEENEEDEEEEEAADKDKAQKETQFKKQFEEWLTTQPSDQVGDWAALAAAGPAARREILDWAKETAVAPASDATTAKRGWTRTWTSGPSPERDTATSFLSQPFIAWFDNDPDDFDSDDEVVASLCRSKGGRRAVAAAWGEGDDGDDDDDDDDDDEDDAIDEEKVIAAGLTPEQVAECEQRDTWASSRATETE